jgi:hypothetical protein
MLRRSCPLRKLAMWFLVTVVKGNRFYENDSPIGNRVLLSDSTDMVISGRATGGGSENDGYRFEARRVNETYIVSDFLGKPTPSLLEAQFLSMAKQMGAVVVAG